MSDVNNSAKDDAVGCEGVSSVNIFDSLIREDAWPNGIGMAIGETAVISKYNCPRKIGKKGVQFGDLFNAGNIYCRVCIDKSECRNAHVLDSCPQRTIRLTGEK